MRIVVSLFFISTDKTDIFSTTYYVAHQSHVQSVFLIQTDYDIKMFVYQRSLLLHWLS